jgi:hypothetical protein
MRTFLWSDFNSFTCFKANKSKQPSSYYHTCLRAYSSERLNEPADDDFLFYLSSIMSSRNTEELLLEEEESSSWECSRENKSKKLNEIKSIHEVFYKFSSRKMKKLLRIKEVCRIILNPQSLCIITLLYFTQMENKEYSKDEEI